MQITFGTFAQLAHVYHKLLPKYEKKHSFSDTKFDIFERKKIIVSHASNDTSHWQTGG